MRIHRLCLLALALVTAVSLPSAAADCTANASPTSDCTNLSLAQQYINANVGAAVTVKSRTTNVPAVQVTADQASFTNSGTLLGDSVGAQGLNIGSTASAITVGTVANSGTIQGYSDSVGILVKSGATVTTMTNSGVVAGGASNAGIKNLGSTITTLTNNASGTISSSSQAGLYNATDTTTPGTIGTVNNYGTISGATYGINNAAANGVLSTIGTVNNFGTISGTTAGIGNGGAIDTINNAQGGASGLTYKGTLPTNYNIKIISTSSYGKLSYLDASTTSSTNFGIYTGSSVKVGTYSSVLSGLSASNISALTGTYQTYSWYLNNRTGNIWDLIIGTSTEDTQTSLSTAAYALSSVLAIKSAAVINGLQSDCAIAPAQNACVSVSGRHAQAIGRNASDNGGAFVIAVRLSDSVRLGLNSDQSFGGRIGDGSLRLTGNDSLVGAFIDWKPQRSGGGFAVKLSAGYEKSPLSITRAVTGYSEPGSGSTDLKTRGLQLTARYAADFGGWLQLTPYAGVRQLRQTVDAYQESAAGSVSAPLSYSALAATSKVGLAGLEMDLALDDMVHLVASGGIESNLYDSDVYYIASGVTGLTPIQLSTSSTRRRANASLGFYVLLSPDSRLSLTGIYREEAWDGLRTARLLATYTAGF
ncbi:MAG: hypothetical protein RL404_2710 [Pseudomonadota bacterium]